LHRVGQAVYIHRKLPCVWWFLCQKYLIHRNMYMALANLTCMTRHWYMTVHLVISLPKTPYIHRNLYMALVSPTQALARNQNVSFSLTIMRNRFHLLRFSHPSLPPRWPAAQVWGIACVISYLPFISLIHKYALNDKIKVLYLCPSPPLSWPAVQKNLFSLLAHFCRSSPFVSTSQLTSSAKKCR